MSFYSRKIFRKVPGNFTFVVITDREDLDGQISAGAAQGPVSGLYRHAAPGPGAQDQRLVR